MYGDRAQVAWSVTNGTCDWSVKRWKVDVAEGEEGLCVKRVRQASTTAENRVLHITSIHIYILHE